MTGRFLTTRFVCWGVFFSFLERLFRSANMGTLIVPPGYVLERWIKRQPTGEESSVGLFRDHNGRRIVIKKIRSRFPSLPYQQMLNEAAILYRLRGKTFMTATGKSVSFSPLLKLMRYHGRMVLVKAYVEGKMLRVYPESEQQAVLNECIAVLRFLPLEISVPFGRRRPWQLAVMMPFHLVKAARKQYREWKVLIWAAQSFLKHFASVAFRPTEYVLTHFDLTPENILIDGNKITILDVEMMSYAHPMTEIALCARYHLINFGNGGMLRFLERHLSSSTEQRQFLALAAYYSLQMLSIDRQEGRYALETLRYLRFLVENENVIASGTPR